MPFKVTVVQEYTMNFSGYDSCEDFDLLLNDLSSEIDYTSTEERSSSSSDLRFETARFAAQNSKRNHQNKKRKIDVVTDNGNVVTFEAGFPRPRVVKTDIRRSFSNMYANAMNSGDFGLMFGFFDTFCNPSFSYVMTKNNLIGNTQKSFSFLRNGIAACAQFWLFHILTVPDAALSLIDTNVITTDNDETSRVVSTFKFKATKIFDCSLVYQGQAIEAPQVQSSPAYTSDAMGSVMSTIKSTVNSVVKTLTLRPEPVSIESTGVLTLFLDSEKRLTKIDMVARSQYTEQEYQALISKNLISY